MKVPSKFKDVLNLLPGATNYVDVGKGDAVGALYEVNVALSELMAIIQDTRSQIERGYYNDLFLMIVNQNQAQPKIQYGSHRGGHFSAQGKANDR